MSKKWMKQLYGAIGTLVMLLPFLLTLGQVNVVRAEPNVVTQKTQKVTLFKRSYDALPDPGQNDGITNPHPGEKSKPVANVIFKVYDVTKQYWELIKDEKSKTEAVKQVSNEIAEAQKGTDNWFSTLSGYTMNPTDKDGRTSVELPVYSTDEKGKKQGNVYAFVEQIDGDNRAGAVPTVVALPVFQKDLDPNGNPVLLHEVKLYPKNVLREMKLGFTKYLVNEKKQSTRFSGAKFFLKSESGQWLSKQSFKDLSDKAIFVNKEEEAYPFVSNKNGVVSTGNLIFPNGKYTFVEANSNVATSAKQAENNKAHFNPTFAKVTAHVQWTGKRMEIKYDYFTSDLVEVKGETDASKVAMYDYSEVPSPQKTVDDPNPSDILTRTYTITQTIPQDIANYTEFKLFDKFSEGLKLVSKKADIAESLTIGGVPLLELLDDNAIQLPTDDTPNLLKVTLFDMQEGRNIGEKMMELLQDRPGDTISMTVKMKVSDWTMAVNEAFFENNIHKTGTKTSSKVYGRKFIKQDGQTNAPLAGAEFIVTRKISDDSGKGEITQYLHKENREGKLAIEWNQKRVGAAVFKSDSNGSFVVDNLDGVAGSQYFLQEITAPEGYELSADAFPFTTVDLSEENEARKIKTVPNLPKGALPSTGGKGIVLFVVVGALMIAGGTIYYKKRNVA